MIFLIALWLSLKSDFPNLSAKTIPILSKYHSTFLKVNPILISKWNQSCKLFERLRLDLLRLLSLDRSRSCKLRDFLINLVSNSKSIIGLLHEICDDALMRFTWVNLSKLFNSFNFNSDTIFKLECWFLFVYLISCRPTYLYACTSCINDSKANFRVICYIIFDYTWTLWFKSFLYFSTVFWNLISILC